ncbi:MAG: NAD-dependent succinate-semialdehyde dehydrogenase [Thermomonas sp.]|uniref:NAD-dependent succinate-semialdehyde dehydrogenase n=1 Tax=Thermomonas sp. TaxID=1971895 RepID=UPI001EB5C4DE|nr:NAD-dependent succinate-semialdehyde dehydrogenase [Thermomonas sp.]MBV2209125.1 NAD-dependent succinate-semialdehyde dehydrogenase [Thermomonas sp.]
MESAAARLHLAHPQLLQQHGLIGGQWHAADSGDRCEVYNPATGELLGHVPDMGAIETRAAIDAAQVAFPAWANTPAKERAHILRKLYLLMMEHQEDLARIMTAEQGKPLAESRGEIAYSASFIEWFGEEAKRMYGDTIPGHAADKRILTLRQPLGVVAAITPWNFPSAMLGRKLGPALAAGCTVVCKPALQTPYSALAIGVLAMQAGLPAGVLNIVTGADAAAIGHTMTAHPSVRKLSFTGSTSVGKQLMAQCADGLKRVSLELGGNAPFIVFEDADLDAAVEGAIASKFRNSGQTCVCANRLYVHTDVYDAFAEKLIAAVRKLRVGDGLAGVTDQGPLIDTKALHKVEAHLADAIEHGARIALGGKRHALGGTFFEPTVLLDVDARMRMAHEETFGPIAPLFRFHNEEEAIDLANATEAGLAGYFYTRDLSRAFRVSEALQCGIVGVNTGLISTEVAPFGGIKQSGVGREGSKYGLFDYTELKYVCIGGI